MSKACDKVLEFRGIKSLILSTSDGSNSSRCGAFVPSHETLRASTLPRIFSHPKNQEHITRIYSRVTVLARILNIF